MSFQYLPVLKVVKVKCPDHSTAQVQGLDEVDLLLDGWYVVEGHPLVALVRVRAHTLVLVLYDSPLAVAETFTNLQYKVGYF